MDILVIDRLERFCAEWRLLSDGMERAAMEWKALRDETRPYPATIGGASFLIPANEARGLLTLSIERMRARKQEIENILGAGHG